MDSSSNTVEELIEEKIKDLNPQILQISLIDNDDKNDRRSLYVWLKEALTEITQAAEQRGYIRGKTELLEEHVTNEEYGGVYCFSDKPRQVNLTPDGDGE